MWPSLTGETFQASGRSDSRAFQDDLRISELLIVISTTEIVFYALDIVLAEMLWAASKAMISGVAILLVLFVLDIGWHPSTLLVPPLLLMTGICFASIALIVNAIAKAYDFFTYYFTLVLTPMIFLSGVYYPVSQLPVWLQSLANILPLGAAVRLVRPLLLGSSPDDPIRDLAILVVYTVAGFYIATVLTRRRLLK